MRVKFNFSKNTIPVPVNNQSLLNGYVHKCLGKNNKYHDTKSDYSISILQGGRINLEDKTLSFEKGAYFTVTSNDNEFIQTLLMGVLTNPELFFGMRFSGVDYVEETFHNGWNYFITLSPFIVKEYTDMKNYKYLTLNDADFNTKLKTYLTNKLSKIDSTLDLKEFDVVVEDRPFNKVKTIMVKNVANKANHCQLNINCNKKVAKLLYTIGIGQSTGSGFGTIYKTENHKVYN